MLRTSLVAVAAVAIVVTTALPADARAKKNKPYNVDATTSLDGRTTGQPRTCGYDYFQYDSRGIPVGPYCH
jgi:hypothetical protein